jgi:hypothetical protein
MPIANSARTQPIVTRSTVRHHRGSDEILAALLEIVVLIEARRGRGQQHRVARFCLGHGAGHGAWPCRADLGGADRPEAAARSLASRPIT